MMELDATRTFEYCNEAITHPRAENLYFSHPSSNDDLPLAVSLIALPSPHVGQGMILLTVIDLTFSQTTRTVTSMPTDKPSPTGAARGITSQKKTIWSNLVETQPKRPIYQYKPLGQGQIRLLRLHAAESYSDPLLCSLDAYHIDDVGDQYDALSYTWGDDDPSLNILLRTPQEPTTGTGKARFQSAIRQTMPNIRFYIRPNLDNALRQFRDPQVDLPLWIDAICIDQANIEEKSIQVARMAEIYSKARDVLIWLGKEYNASNTAMEFIPKILDLEQSQALISKESNRKQWTALADLMKREWFSRRWIVQELVLAKNRYLYCGDKVLHWDDFERAVSFFTNKLDTIRTMFTSSAEFRHNTKNLADVKALGASALVDITNEFVRREDGSLERRNTLESLVARLPMFEALDPRDIIYSLLSIAEDTQPLNSLTTRKQDNFRERGLVPFEADYGKDILEVYKDFTAFCIQTSGFLDIICRHWAPSHARRPSLLSRLKTLTEKDRSQADFIAGDNNSEEELSPMVKLHLPSWIGLLSESPYGIPDAGRSAGDSLVIGPRYLASGDSRASVRFGEIDAPRNQGMSSALNSFDSRLFGWISNVTALPLEADFEY